MEMRQKDNTVKHLELLYGPYEPEWYYWEVIETLRRLLATSALLLLPSSVVRIVAAIVLSLATLKLYGMYAPFIDRSDDILAETLQWVTCLLMLAMLLTLMDVNGIQHIMIALQLAAVLIVVVLVTSDISREKKAIVKAMRSTRTLRRSVTSLLISPKAPGGRKRVSDTESESGSSSGTVELADVGLAGASRAGPSVPL
jgi:hypothetical protein